MANELRAYLASGKALYAALLSATGQAWNGSAFEALAGANWATYDIALTEAVAGVYLGNMPSVAAGVYTYLVYEQAGAAPANTDALRGMGCMDWDGSAECAIASRPTASDLADVAADVTELLSLAGGGAGAQTYVETIRDGAGTPIDGVRVQLCTDAAGTQVRYEAFTNAAGAFSMRVDPGTYYRYLERAGYTFVQGVTVTILPVVAIIT